jgi:Lrp/AsnC family transcriptional regulator for asnA, asnC and gidA
MTFRGFFMELDRVDHMIISHLLVDGRVPFSSIAKEIKLTDVAIKKRFERLKKRGIISDIKACLDLKLLGYENPIYVQIRSEMSKTKEVLKRIRELDYVLELNQTLGEYNIFAKIVVPSIDSSENFINKLCTIDGVMDTKTMIVMKEIKNSSSLPSQPLQKKI